MAQGVLSAKLGELDQRFTRLHTRIQLSETADQEQIRENVRALQKECVENRLLLKDSMKVCKAKNIALISSIYDRVDEVMDEVHKKLELPVPSGRDGELYVETVSLLAEYMLDFAMQAADEALLVSMKAISSQQSRMQ